MKEHRQHNQYNFFWKLFCINFVLLLSHSELFEKGKKVTPCLRKINFYFQIIHLHSLLILQFHCYKIKNVIFLFHFRKMIENILQLLKRMERIRQYLWELIFQYFSIFLKFIRL